MKRTLEDWARLLGKNLVLFPKEGRAIVGQLVEIGLSTCDFWVEAPGPGPILNIAWSDLKQALEIGTRAVYRRPELTFEQLIRGTTLQIRLAGEGKQLGTVVKMEQKKDFLRAVGATEEAQRG